MVDLIAGRYIIDAKTAKEAPRRTQIVQVSAQTRGLHGKNVMRTLWGHLNTTFEAVTPDFLKIRRKAQGRASTNVVLTYSVLFLFRAKQKAI